MRRSDTLLSVLALVGALLAPAPARAEEVEIARIVAAHGDACLAEPALAAQVAGWLGRERFEGELGVRVEADAGSRGATIHIAHRGADVASRRFEHLPERCEDRRAVIALAIALALDAALLESLGVAAPEHGERSEPTTPARPPAGERPALSLEAEALLFVELLPDVALAGSVAVAALLGEGVRVRLGAIATQRGGAPIASGSAELSLVGGRADGCFGRVVAPSVFVGGCAGAIVGAAFAEGRALLVTRTAEIPWVLAIGRAELRWLPLDALAFTVGFDAHFAIVRPRLEVGDGAGGIVDARSVPGAGVAIALGAAMVIE